MEALDIETIWDNEVAKALCIAITSKSKIFFKQIDIDNCDDCDIIEFLLEKCSSKKIYYVHNLTFEMFVFLSNLIKKKIKFKLISGNKTIYAAEIGDTKKIKLRCSYKLTMLSLRELAEMAEINEKTIFPYKILEKGIFKKEMIINDSMFKNFNEYIKFKDTYGEKIDTYKILEEYCKNDALITKNSIIKYWKIIEEGGLKNNKKILTAAKLSIVNYFEENKIIKKKIRLRYDRLLRNGYFGGRTEVFGNPKEDEILLHYDWTGMYAQCMCEKVLGGEIIESTIIKDLNHPGFYWIKFRQNLEYPILPIREGKLIFKNGVFQGWYWFEEILLAIEYGVEIICVKKVISSQYYDNFIESFIKTNNKIREISKLHKQIGKNNNNTFYGRLGMDPNRMGEEVISNIEIESKKYEKIVSINGAYIGYTKREKSISNITIAASITSKARIKLYRGMMNVKEAGGRLIYTDTDSIIAAFNKHKYKEILDKQLGEVCFHSKLNDTIILDGVFAMPKTYALKYENNEIVKIKGFKSKPTFEEFKKIFYEKGVIETINTEWNKKDLVIRKIEKTKKTSLYGLNKRKWKDCLKETEPLTD